MSGLLWHAAGMSTHQMMQRVRNIDSLQFSVAGGIPSAGASACSRPCGMHTTCTTRSVGGCHFMHLGKPSATPATPIQECQPSGNPASAERQTRSTDDQVCLRLIPARIPPSPLQWVISTDSNSSSLDGLQPAYLLKHVGNSQLQGICSGDEAAALGLVLRGS